MSFFRHAWYLAILCYLIYIWWHYFLLLKINSMYMLTMLVYIAALPSCGLVIHIQLFQIPHNVKRKDFKTTLLDALSCIGHHRRMNLLEDNIFFILSTKTTGNLPFYCSPIPVRPYCINLVPSYLHHFHHTCVVRTHIT